MPAVLTPEAAAPAPAVAENPLVPSPVPVVSPVVEVAELWRELQQTRESGAGGASQPLKATPEELMLVPASVNGSRRPSTTSSFGSTHANRRPSAAPSIATTSSLPPMPDGSGSRRHSKQSMESAATATSTASAPRSGSELWDRLKASRSAEQLVLQPLPRLRSLQSSGFAVIVDPGYAEKP